MGDDLYCHQPLCEDALARGFQVLFVCKPDSHRALYEWVSDFERTGDLQTLERTVVAIATAGRTRSKIENENNNVLKNHGYHFEHNFGHGKQHLANLLAALIVLAYLVHTALDWIDVCYRTVRGLLPSRRTFFEHLRALLQYLPFESWDHLLKFMLDELEGKIPDSG